MEVKDYRKWKEEQCLFRFPVSSKNEERKDVDVDYKERKPERLIENYHESKHIQNIISLCSGKPVG